MIVMNFPQVRRADIIHIISIIGLCPRIKAYTEIAPVGEQSLHILSLGVPIGSISKVRVGLAALSDRFWPLGGGKKIIRFSISRVRPVYK